MSKVFTPKFETKYLEMSDDEIDSLSQLEVDTLYNIFLSLTLNRMISLIENCCRYGWTKVFQKRLSEPQYLVLLSTACESPIYLYSYSEGHYASILLLIYFDMTIENVELRDRLIAFDNSKFIGKNRECNAILKYGWNNIE